MTEWLRALTAQAENQSLVPGTDSASHKHPQLQFQGLYSYSLTLSSMGSSCMQYIYTHTHRQTFIHMFFFLKEKQILQDAFLKCLERFSFSSAMCNRSISSTCFPVLDLICISVKQYWILFWEIYISLMTNIV